MLNNIDRILDANLNRAREGLRVVEEIVRLEWEDNKLHSSIKKIRHKISSIEKLFTGSPVILSRSVLRDPGAKHTSATETKRKDTIDLMRANLRRSQEALRVLEEISKLKTTKISKHFKETRFELYRLEQKLFKRMVKL